MRCHFVPGKPTASAPVQDSTTSPKDDDLKREAWAAGIEIVKNKYPYAWMNMTTDYNPADIRLLDGGDAVFAVQYRGSDYYGNRAIRRMTARITKKNGKWSLVQETDEVVR